VSSLRVISTLYLPIRSISGWSVRPFVDAAVARIKDDYGARIIARLCHVALDLAAHIAAGIEAIVERYGVQERLPANRRQLHNEARRQLAGSVDYGRFFHPYRARQIEHNTRSALHHLAEAKCLYQPLASLADTSRKLEIHLREIHDKPVRVCECEHPRNNAAGEIEHDPGLVLVPD
jgi:hypothetical protein